MFWIKCGFLETTLTQPQGWGQKCGIHWPRWAGSQWACTAHTQLSKKVHLSLTATNADDLNCIKLLRKINCIPGQYKDLSMDIGCFPTAASKKFIWMLWSIFFPEIPSAKPSVEPLWLQNQPACQPPPFHKAQNSNYSRKYENLQTSTSSYKICSISQLNNCLKAFQTKQSAAKLLPEKRSRLLSGNDIERIFFFFIFTVLR